MNASQHLHLQSREPRLRQVPNPRRRLDEHVLRALNKIKRPSTAEEITELLNEDLGPGDRPFQVNEITTWLRDACEAVTTLFWLESRPRR
jgi:hypothetical protein